MSTKEFRCIGTLVLKSLLNTLGRAVEQLGECLAKISSRGQSATVVINKMTSNLASSAWYQDPPQKASVRG